MKLHASFNSEKLNNMKMLSLFALVIVSHFALAQNYDQLEDIQVTAVKGNKDERTFIETNESVSILKSKNLNRSDLNNSVQMLNGLANVQTQSDKNGDTFSIRGISDMGVTGYQKDNLATILVDEIFQTTLAVRAGSFENWDLNSVEVRRGAQSTDQGVNSLAGNILLFHNAPSEIDQGAAKLVFGNFGRKEGAFLINKKVSDKVAVRLSYNKEMGDGFIENTTTNNDKWNERNKDHAMMDVLYRLSAKDNVRLFLKVLRMNRGGSYVQDVDDLEVAEDQDYKEITNNQQAGLIYERLISDNVMNKLIIGATRGDSSVKSDEDGTSINVAGTRKGNDKDHFLSLENQLKYKSDNIKNVLGVHLHQYYLNNFYDFNLMFTPSVQYPVTQENTKERTTYALFDTFVYDFNDNHSFLVGGRFEVVKNKFAADIHATAFPTLSGKHEDSSTNAVILPKIGYTYKSGHYSIGATYSEGYRTGGVSVNRRQTRTNSYDPEKTHNYEISFKHLQGRSLFAANAFYTKWNDQQVEIINNGDTFDTDVKNASKSELYGLELESAYQFQNADSIRVNVGYVHTQFLSFNNADKSFTGNQFPDAAPLTGQVSYWKVLNDEWMLVLVSRYVSESFSDPDNERWAPEQFYTDINLQYVKEQYMLEFYTRNVFDQKYRIFNGSPRSTTTPYQASYHRVSAPREFGARLNYYW